MSDRAAAPNAADPGAVSERTLLAWRRTALLIGVTSVLGARLLADTLGPSVFALALLGLALSVAAHGYASARYRHGKRQHPGDTQLMAASPRGLGALAGAVVVLSMIGFLAVFTIHEA